MGFLGGKLEPTTSEALQTGCRNAAAFVQLPRHYHKGLWGPGPFISRVGTAFSLPSSKAALASFLWPGKAK